MGRFSALSGLPRLGRFTSLSFDFHKRVMSFLKILKEPDPAPATRRGKSSRPSAKKTVRFSQFVHFACADGDEAGVQVLRDPDLRQPFQLHELLPPTYSTRRLAARARVKALINFWEKRACGCDLA